MLIGNKSLNSILGSWDLIHSSVFQKAGGAPASTEADPAGVLGGYSLSDSKQLEFDFSRIRPRVSLFCLPFGSAADC